MATKDMSCYTIGRYSVVVGYLQEFTSNKDDTRVGYLVRNNTTGVAEFGTTLLYNAIQAAQQSEQLTRDLETKTEADILSGTWPQVMGQEAAPTDVA